MSKSNTVYEVEGALISVSVQCISLWPILQTIMEKVKTEKQEN